MEGPRLNAAARRLAHALRHADRPLLAGLALLAGAAALHWGAAASLRAGVQQRQQEAAAAQQQAQLAGRERQRREALSPAARLEALHRIFPAEASAPDWLEKVHDAAARHQVQLAQAEYRTVRGKPAGLVGVQVTYPVRGGYAQLRRFLAQVLREVPAASLDEVSFRRDAIAQGEVQATVRLTLHLKERP